MSDHLLSPIITAHCFWSPRCKQTVSDRPDAAHAAMEAHYAAAHGRDMDRVLRSATGSTDATTQPGPDRTHTTTSPVVPCTKETL